MVKVLSKIGKKNAENHLLNEQVSYICLDCVSLFFLTQWHSDD